MKFYIVIWGQIIIGDNSLDFTECCKTNVSDFVWQDKEQADKFAKKRYAELKKYIGKNKIDDERKEFGYYEANFIDRYGDSANEIYAYVKEVECIKKM